jgi:hypothetical protein
MLERHATPNRYGIIKVKFFLSQAVKGRRGSRGIALLIL